MEELLSSEPPRTALDTSELCRNGPRRKSACVVVPAPFRDARTSLRDAPEILRRLPITSERRSGPSDRIFSGSEYFCMRPYCLSAPYRTAPSQTAACPLRSRPPARQPSCSAPSSAPGKCLPAGSAGNSAESVLSLLFFVVVSSLVLLVRVRSILISPPQQDSKSQSRIALFGGTISPDILCPAGRYPVPLARCKRLITDWTAPGAHPAPARKMTNYAVNPCPFGQVFEVCQFRQRLHHPDWTRTPRGITFSCGGSDD